MQGCSDLSFLPTKKKPAPAGDQEGWMIPAANEDLYSSMACRSEAERECKRPLGGKCPEGDQWLNHRDGRRQGGGLSLIEDVPQFMVDCRDPVDV